MLIQGSVSNTQKGMRESISAMHMQMELVGIRNSNIQGFDKIGYQRKEPVVSSFADMIGVHAISESTDESVGRIAETLKPLDLAIANKGYFQLVDKNGTIQLTRDGRFHLNQNGELLGITNEKVLSQGGTPIVMSFMPDSYDDIKIDNEGKIYIFNPKTNKLDYQDTVGVVSSEGRAVLEPDIKQKFLEFSNVNLAQEYMEVTPYRKTFSVNATMFKIQSSALQNAIQQLGGN